MSLSAVAQPEEAATDAEQTEGVTDVTPPEAAATDAAETETPTTAPEDQEFAYENDQCNGKSMSDCDAAVDGCMWCDSADIDFKSESYDPTTGTGICMSA